MRIVKEAEERKNEILDATSILFSEKGSFTPAMMRMFSGGN